MNRKPLPPSAYTLLTKQARCPKCDATCVVKIGPQQRCNQCGEQWPPIQRTQQGPTRRDVLNGTARYVPGRIIFWGSADAVRKRSCVARSAPQHGMEPWQKGAPSS